MDGSTRVDASNAAAAPERVTEIEHVDRAVSRLDDGTDAVPERRCRRGPLVTARLAHVRRARDDRLGRGCPAASMETAAVRAEVAAVGLGPEPAARGRVGPARLRADVAEIDQRTVAH